MTRSTSTPPGRSKVPYLRKQREGRGLNPGPPDLRFGARGVNRSVTHASPVKDEFRVIIVYQWDIATKHELNGAMITDLFFPFVVLTNFSSFVQNRMNRQTHHDF